MKNKLKQFMYGRYGNDDLNHTLVGASLISAVLSIFILQRLFLYLTYFFIAVSIYRSFSRKTSDRYRENIAYLQFIERLPFPLPGKRKGGNVPKDKTKKIFICPSCSQKVRVPKGKGTIMITCPKCSHQFKKRT